MKRRFVTGILAGMAASGVLLAASSAQAQEIQLTGPLKGAPAVRHLRLYREGRFEVAPAASFTLLDEYRRTILVGARLNYNLKDWVGIGAWGAFGAVSLTTDLTDKIDTTAPRDPLTAENVNHSNPGSGGNASFADQTAKISYVFAPQVTFVPFRGKLAIFNKIFVDTDFYVAPGLGIVGISERNDCAAPAQPCNDPRSFQQQSKTKITGTFGLGFTFYLSDLISFNAEYRALPFSWNRAGFDSRGSGTNGNFPDHKVNEQDETFRWNQMITLALGFSFPSMKISE